MKEKKLDLQYIIAHLMSHSKLINILYKNPHLILNYFKTTPCYNNIKLMEFINKNFRNIYITACLNEKKRWTEMLNYIEYTKKIININLLKNEWQYYLESTINDTIPKSSLLESIHYLRFLRNRYKSKTINNVLRYEIIKNETLAFNFKNKSLNNQLSCKGNKVDNCYLNINKSLKICKFSISITNLIKQIYLNQTINIIPTNERIGFYKSLSDNSLKIILIHKDVHDIIQEINNNPNIKKLIKNTKMKSPYLLLNKLIQLEVIEIISKDVENVV